MNTFEIDVILTIEASDMDDAEDFLRDFLDGEPAIIDYTVHPHMSTAVV